MTKTYTFTGINSPNQKIRRNSKNFRKYIAILFNICYNIRMGLLLTYKHPIISCKGAFMWNENKADRAEKYLQGI